MLLGFLGGVAPASAQAPAAPISIVVAFPPGGPADRLARALAQRISDTEGRAIVVENKPGASGMIAANYVARTSSPDTTLFLSNAGALTINPALYSKLSYDPAKDFKPVTMVADSTTVMVTWAPTDLQDAADLAARMKRNEKEFRAGSSGVGGVSYLNVEMFNEGAGVKLLNVPYKGAASVFTDLVGRRVDVFFGDLPGLQGLLSSGKIKALGVAADKPSPLLPGVRTLGDQGIPGVIPSGWYGVVMSSGASSASVQAMAKTIHRALDNNEARQQFQAMGAMVVLNTPGEFSEQLVKDSGRWRALVQRLKLSAD